MRAFGLQGMLVDIRAFDFTQLRLPARLSSSTHSNEPVLMDRSRTLEMESEVPLASFSS